MPLHSPGRGSRWAIAAIMFLGSAIYCLRSYPIPCAAYFGHDTWQYQQMAVNFSAGYGLRLGAILPVGAYQFAADIQDGYESAWDAFIETGQKGGEPLFYRQPGYPFMLGVVYSIFGVRPDIAMLLQMTALIAIGSLLPIVANQILGARGYYCGLAAGLILSLFVSSRALALLTETLIAAACFAVLVVWLQFVQQRTLLWGLTFGFTLAGALLVKGSLVFIPPLFVGYIILRSWKPPRPFSPAPVVAIVFAFAAPLIAYSSWASSMQGEAIVLTTQGRDVVLDGHNELVLETGLWSPLWRPDPNTFYSKALAADPDQGVLTLLVKFYRAHPSYLPRIALRKIEALGAERDLIDRFAISGLIALTFLYTTMSAFRQASLVVRSSTFAISVLAILASGFAPITSLVGGAIAAFAGVFRHSFREQAARLWADSGVIALVIIALNFFLLTIATFENVRFLVPGYFALMLITFYLALRIAEELSGLLPGRSERATSELK